MFRRLALIFGIRSRSVFLFLYLLLVVLIFYIGLYKASVMVENSCESKCFINKSMPEDKTLLKFGINEERNSKPERIKTFLLIIILTGPNYGTRRNAMRMTWLNVTGFTFVRRFVVGTSDLDNATRKQLEQEQNLHGDMLLLQHFKDSYKQLTRKLLNTFIWISENVDCAFVMKADDDTFARLDVIEQELKVKYSLIDNLYWGFHRGDSRVKYTGPWAEPKWILCDRYLPYALGGGYIISMKLVQYIANVSSLLVLYNSEDVSLGVWLSPLKLTRIHDPRFDTEWRSRGCKNVHIVSHKQSIEDMYNKYNTLKDYGRLCMKEQFLAKSFIYSWNVPPSQCCMRKNGIS